MKFKKNGKKRKTWRKMTAREGGGKPADQRGGGIQRPRVPCADLTPLALCQSDSVGLHGHAEVIINDVIAESEGMRPF